jgi:hypothetical protein
LKTIFQYSIYIVAFTLIALISHVFKIYRHILRYSRFCVLSVSIVHAVSAVFTAVGFPIFSVSPGVHALASIPTATGASSLYGTSAFALLASCDLVKSVVVLLCNLKCRIAAYSFSTITEVLYCPL